MNDLDFSGLGSDSILYIPDFQGVLDGNGFSFLNLSVGLNSYMNGIDLYSGATVKNLTIRVTTAGVGSDRGLFGKDATRQINNVTLSNIKIYVDPSISLYNILPMIYLSGCIIEDIIIEAASYSMINEVRGPVTNVKVLRHDGVDSAKGYPMIEKIYQTSVVSNCQYVNLNSFSLTPNYPIGVFARENYGLIKECLIVMYVNNHYLDPNSSNPCSTLVHENSGKIQDCLIKGKFEVDGGVGISLGVPAYSGSTCISNNIFHEQYRCVVDMDLTIPFDPNRRMFYWRSVSNGLMANNYYNSSRNIPAMADLAGIQEGLTQEQFLLEESFVGFDFINTWEMLPEGISLKNNKLYAFESPIISVVVNTVTRLNSSEIEVSLTNKNADNYGVEILKNGILVDNVENQTTFIINTLSDANYDLKPYYIDGNIKTYGNTKQYRHYFIDQLPIEIVDISNQNYIPNFDRQNTNPLTTLYPTLKANGIHGSLIYNGYVYGSTRNTYDGNGLYDSMSCFVKININNPQDWQTLEINCGDVYPNLIL